MKLLATADWHIGAGSEYGRRPGDRLNDQRDVALQIADLAIDEAVDGVLIAGDLLEGPAMLPEHLEVITAFIDRLQGRIPVLACSGNGKHDLSMRSTNGLAIFNHIDGIQVSSTPDVYPFAGCAVATLPWVSPARLVAARAGGGDRDEIHADVAQLLVDIADHARADCDRVAPGAPAILMAHWSVGGASLPNGLLVDQLREPVITLADLAAVGYDAIVLGHIHKSQDLREGLFSERRVQPPIWYVGSPMPLNHGEAGFAHGAWIIDIEAGSVGEIVWAPIASRQFVTHELDLTTHEGIFALAALEPIPDGAIVRIRYRATAEQQRTLDVASWRRDLIEQGAAVVKVQPDIVRAYRARVEGLDEGVGELDALEQWMLAQGIVGVDEPVELAEPTRLLAEAMRTRTRGYLEAAA